MFVPSKYLSFLFSISLLTSISPGLATIKSSAADSMQTVVLNHVVIIEAGKVYEPGALLSSKD